MLIQADLDCTFRLDDQPSQVLKAGEIKRIASTLGEHLVRAVTADGKDRWKAVVDLDKPVQKVVLIELMKVRATRQVAEQQVAQLQQEIAAKELKANGVSEATQALGEQQKQVKKQRQEIEDQIDALQKQVREEVAAAQDDESRAQRLGMGAATAREGTTLGNLTKMVGTVGASDAADSAAKHRANARELQNQILDLNRKLERLNTGEVAQVVVGQESESSSVPILPGIPPATLPLSIDILNDSAVGVADTGIMLLLKHMGWSPISANLYVISGSPNERETIRPYTNDRSASARYTAWFTSSLKTCDGSHTNVDGSEVWCFHVEQNQIKPKKGMVQSLGVVTSKSRRFDVSASYFYTNGVKVELRDAN